MIDKNMKKLIIISLLLLLSFFLTAENNLKELVTGNAYDWSTLPREERAYGGDAKIIYKIEVKKIS